MGDTPLSPKLGMAEIDEEKLNFYMSPFRKDRSSNPHSWDSKMKFWTDTVKSYCVRNNIIVFNSKDLPEKLAKDSKCPQCLDVVLQDMLKKKLIQPYSDYLSSCNQNWLSWSINTIIAKPIKWGYNTFIKSSMSWAYSWLSSFVSSDDDDYKLNLFNNQSIKLPDENFVMVDLLKGAASKIYSHHSNTVMYDVTDNIVNYEHLHQECRHICSNDESFDAAIMEMCRQNMCRVKMNQEKEKIIIMTTSNTNKKSPMSGNELKIYKLKMAEKKVESEITKIENQMEECRLSAKQLLQQGKKNMALKHLKKKKILEGILKQREQSIDKIGNLISIIQQTESHKQILDAYSSGVQAFKGLRQRTGLDESTIDNTMLDIQEAFEANEQINQSISQPITDNTEYDMDELEAELNDILNTTSVNDYMKELEDLPTVPTHEPGLTPPKLTETTNRKRVAVKDHL